MHTDESVNAYITGRLLADDSFHYDPQDRHGPALFVLAGPLAKLLGANRFSELTEAQLRLTPVIVGSATVLLLGAGVEMFGFVACLIAALLFAIAPLPVYYSRYFIHEPLFVIATIGLIFSGWKTLNTPTLPAAALAGFCAALMLACKETAVIHYFAFTIALIVYFLTRPATTPRWCGGGGILFTALGMFIFITVLLFTWFGRNWSVFGDLLHAIPRFAARAGGEGHAKPFGYYFHLLDPLFVLFLLAATGIYAALCQAVSDRRQPGLLLVIYGLVVFLIYSAIPYKTPWLALNLFLPLSLLCGLGVAGFCEQISHPAGRWGTGLAVGALLMTLGTQTKELDFDHPADEKNPFAYAHTTEDFLELPKQLTELAQRHKIAAPKIAVVAADAWPLPWYLRKYSTVGFWQPGQEPGTADFLITTTDVPQNLAERLKSFRPDFFSVRPNVLMILWSPLSSPAQP